MSAIAFHVETSGPQIVEADSVTGPPVLRISILRHGLTQFDLSSEDFLNA